MTYPAVAVRGISQTHPHCDVTGVSAQIGLGVEYLSIVSDRANDRPDS